VEIGIHRIDGDVERLFAEESAKIWRSVLLHTGEFELARDATAEAFAQLLRSGSRVRDPRAWVWRAAFRIADRELGRRSHQPVVDVADPYEMPEQIVDLVRALRRLPATQREAVVLHHMADRSVAEIASILGTSAGAVAVHLHRGRRRLRELLEEPDG
jgi:RNA polymerase sigma-70 factor, ECF subfamily